MKKIVLTAVAVFSVLLVLTGCPGAAGGSVGGTNSGEIDYLARLIGTWQTPGFETGEFITRNDPDDPSKTFKVKAKYTFTATTHSGFLEVKDSTSTNIPDRAHEEKNRPLSRVDNENFYLSGTWQIPYEIKNNALYVLGFIGPMYKK